MTNHLSSEASLRIGIASQDFRPGHIRPIRKRRDEVAALAHVELVLLARWAFPAFPFRGPRRFCLEPKPACLRQQGRVLGLNPVGDGDVDIGFVGPRLVLDRLDDGAILDDVVEPATRDLLLRMFCVPTSPARPAAGSPFVHTGR